MKHHQNSATSSQERKKERANIVAGEGKRAKFWAVRRRGSGGGPGEATFNSGQFPLGPVFCTQANSTKDKFDSGQFVFLTLVCVPPRHGGRHVLCGRVACCFSPLVVDLLCGIWS